VTLIIIIMLRNTSNRGNRGGQWLDKLCEENETIKGIEDDGTNYSTTFLDQKLVGALSGSRISRSCVKGETEPKCEISDDFLFAATTIPEGI
jgi:hypothetical protein